MSVTTTAPILARPLPGRDLPTCPECKTPVKSTKGEHPTPDHAPGKTTYGFRCQDCNVVIPILLKGRDAEGLADSLVGRQASFRDGRDRFIPVPESQVE